MGQKEQLSVRTQFFLYFFPTLPFGWEELQISQSRDFPALLLRSYFFRWTFFNVEALFPNDRQKKVLTQSTFKLS